MRLSFFVWCIFMLALAPGNVFAQDPVISIESNRSMSVDQVFDLIQDQTGYEFIYNVNLFENYPKIEVPRGNIKISDLLDISLAKGGFLYEFDGNLILLYSGGNGSLMSGQRTITGKVTDEEGLPLIGASVVVKGTSKGTATGFDGMYSLDRVDGGDTLVFTSIGSVGEEVEVDGRDTINVVLQKDVVVLDEVELVSTGYQKIEPEQSTGSVATITTKAYESQISTNFTDGLENRLPGLLINNDVPFTSNLDGTELSRNLFNIRGISTILGNSDPLIVIDGYPTILSLDMLDPNDIKSVTVLKDAAAASIYGVRASNGVIIIERKKASVGEPRFTFRTTLGFTPKTNYDRYRWAEDASAISTAYLRNRYTPSGTASVYERLGTISLRFSYPTPLYILAELGANVITPAQAEERFDDLSNYNNLDDYERLFLRTAVTQSYFLGVSGGSPKMRYNFTANYTQNRLEQINNENNRILLSGRSTFQFTDRLTLDLNLDFQVRNDDTAPIPSVNSIYPHEPFQDSNGNPTAVTNGSGVNPYYNEVLQDNGLLDHRYYPLVDAHHITNKANTVNNRIMAHFNYDMGDAWSLSLGGIYETSRTNARYYADEESSQARQLTNRYASLDEDGTLIFNIPVGGYLKETNATASSYTLRAQLNYDGHIGEDHSINAILGGEIRNELERGSTASYFGYDDETLLQQPGNYQLISTGSLFFSPFFLGVNAFPYDSYFGQRFMDDRYVSLYSNIVYTFKDRYSLSGSARIDRSNLFGTDIKYLNNPLWSVGAAWVASKEPFLDDTAWLDLLKLRVAYGLNGNLVKNSIPRVTAERYLNNLTNPVSVALTRASYINSSLRWEQTKNINIGFDYGIFGNIRGSVDWYTKKSTDLLANAQIDPTLGESPALLNQASVTNKGLEIGVHANWIGTPKFNWNTDVIFSKNTSNVDEVFAELEYSPLFYNNAGFIKGYPIGAMFAYNWAGLDNQGYPQVTNGDQVYSMAAPPEELFDIMRGDNDSGVSRYVGSSIPTRNIGFNNSVNIGNLNVFAMINYYGGFKVFVPRANPSSYRPLEGAGNYWKEPGDENITDAPNLDSYNNQFAMLAYNYSDVNVVDGDYITLRNITASYAFRNGLFKKLGFDLFEVKAQVSNVWTVGLNRDNYSRATGSYARPYITPTYSFGLFTNF